LVGVGVDGVLWSSGRIGAGLVALASVRLRVDLFGGSRAIGRAGPFQRALAAAIRRTDRPGRCVIDRAVQRGRVLVIGQRRASTDRTPGGHIGGGRVGAMDQYVVGDRGGRFLLVLGVLGHQLDADRGDEGGGVDLALARLG